MSAADELAIGDSVARHIPKDAIVVGDGWGDPFPWRLLEPDPDLDLDLDLGPGLDPGATAAPPVSLCLAILAEGSAGDYTPDPMLPLAEKLAPVGPSGRYRPDEAAHTKRTQPACGQAFNMILMEFNMTTKILTVRVPSALYTSLCEAAGEAGMPISALVRRQLERENDALQLAALLGELLSRLDMLALASAPVAATASDGEVLLLCRAVAAHLNPQMVVQVRAKLMVQPQ